VLVAVAMAMAMAMKKKIVKKNFHRHHDRDQDRDQASKKWIFPTSVWEGYTSWVGQIASEDFGINLF
jgi:hypothetical protein